MPVERKMLILERISLGTLFDGLGFGNDYASGLAVESL